MSRTFRYVPAGYDDSSDAIRKAKFEKRREGGIDRWAARVAQGRDGAWGAGSKDFDHNEAVEVVRKHDRNIAKRDIRFYEDRY